MTDNEIRSRIELEDSTLHFVLGCTKEDLELWYDLDSQILEKMDLQAKEKDRENRNEIIKTINQLYREKCRIWKRFVNIRLSE